MPLSITPLPVSKPHTIDNTIGKQGIWSNIASRTLKNIRSDCKMNFREGFLLIKDGNYMN